MQATAVCKRLFALSQGLPQIGTVHSVFEHAVNLELGEDWLAGLIAQEKALTPYAVSVRTNDSFAQTVRAGMAAHLWEGILSIPEAGITLDLSCAACIDLSVDSIELRHFAGAAQTLEQCITQALKTADATTSLAPLATGGAGNVYTRFLAPRLERLFSTVKLGTWDEAAQAAASCAGCGMGLTPSSDDLLCGYFTTLHLIDRANGNANAKANISAMAQAAAGKTSRISGSFLLESGMALANVAVCDLFRSILTDPDTSTLARAISRVLEIGSTSGADTLTGTVLALRQHIGGNET